MLQERKPKPKPKLPSSSPSPPPKAAPKVAPAAPVKTLGWGYHGRIHGLVDVDVEPLVDGKCVFLDVDVLMFVLLMLVVFLIVRES